MLSSVKSPLAERILRKMLNAGERKVLGRIGSGQLAKALNTRVTKTARGTARGRLNVPHYWAKYYHSGRGTAVPKRATVLIWFRNPANDPRLRMGRYPVSKSQSRRLTKSEFKRFSALNRKKIQAYKKSTGKTKLTSSDYMRMNLPMVVAKASPRAGGVAKSNPFFSNEPGGGMYNFDKLAGNIAARETYNYVEEQLKKRGLKSKVITRTLGTG